MSMSFGKQAIVVGAGMGGLTAARALADHFERVVVLDRDALPQGPALRTGTPQARHLHILLGGGQRALEALFPGMEEDLERAGAVRFHITSDIRVERPGYDPFPPRDLGWFGYSLSRPMIELTVRRRVEQHANITLRQRCRAQEILVTPGGTAIAGVRRDSAERTVETLPGRSRR